MLGGLLAAVLTCFKAVSVQAEESSITLNSGGVLKFEDGKGKSVVFDSSDLYELKGIVEGVSVPKLKVTYHEHTSSCSVTRAVLSGYATGAPGIYLFTDTSGTQLTAWPTADSTDATARYICVLCNNSAYTKRYKSTSSAYGQKDVAFGDTHMVTVSMGVPDFTHKDTCPFKYASRTSNVYTYYTCGKTTDTIESVTLVTDN